MNDLNAIKALSTRTREEWDSVFDGGYNHSYWTVLNLLNKIDLLVYEVERLRESCTTRPVPRYWEPGGALHAASEETT